jgi:anti-sigma B factor antagonist
VPITLTEHHDGAATVVAADGIVDMAAAPALTNQIRDILRRRPEVLVVDLTAVSFLSTAGMSVLMEADRKTRQLGIAFRVVAHSPVTVRPMELLGIDDQLSIYPTLAAALDGAPPRPAPTG